MNHIHRAQTSIFRNPGKSVTYVLIIILLGTTIATSIFINHAVQSSTAHLQQRIPPVAIIEPNWDSVMEVRNLTGELPSLHISPELIRTIGTLDMVRGYDFNARASLYNSDLIAYESSRSQQTKASFISANQWVLRGVDNPNLIDIEEGIIELVSGRIFSNEEVRHISNVGLISEQFAYLNQLSLGSTIPMRNDVYGTEGIITSEWFEVEIIGIFRPIVSNQTFDILDILQNRIYVTNTFVELINRFSWEHCEFQELSQDYFYHTLLSNFFSFYDIEGVQEFRFAARAKGLPSHFEVVDAGSSIATISDNLQTLEQISDSILYLTIILSIGILALLMILFLKNRQYEIGIYRSLGEKPHRLMSQLLSEIFLIACIGLVVAFFAGLFLSNQISQQMIINELQAIQNSAGVGQFANNDTLAMMGYQTTFTTESVYTALQDGIGYRAILWFLGVGLSTVLVSTIAPFIYMLRMNPKKIMM